MDLKKASGVGGSRDVGDEVPGIHFQGWWRLNVVSKAKKRSQTPSGFPGASVGKKKGVLQSLLCDDNAVGVLWMRVEATLLDKTERNRKT